MSIEIGVLVSVLSLLIGFLGYLLNKQKDARELTTKTVTQDAQLSAQLQYISKGVDDIRIDLKANERQMAALTERVTRVEESNKQAHRRIDQVVEKGITTK